MTSPDVQVGRRRFRHARHGSGSRLVALTAAVVVTAILAGSIAVLMAVAKAHHFSVGAAPSTRSAAASTPAGGSVGRSGGGPIPRAPRSPASGGAAATIGYPIRGAGDWHIADGRGAVGGTGGRLLRYQVAVEKGIRNLDAADFGAQVSAILADPRSWVGTGRVRLQRVGPQDPPDFVVYLATPATRDDLCARGYDRYTSCRNGDKVVINVARWVRGAIRVGGDLRSYRQYTVNHEVGHRLGHGHERCPGHGRPAPLMQQQTLGLHGCRPNPWPVQDGHRYRGPSGAYDDSIPQSDRQADTRQADH